MLLLVAALWGAGFVAQKLAMDSMGPFEFNALRYAIGAALLAVPVLVRRKASPPKPRTLIAGSALGVVMFAAAGLQQTGMITATASRTAFLTGIYVLIVPAIGIFFRQRITGGHIAGGVLAVIGLALIGGDGSTDLLSGLTRGDWLVLACAVLWALHVVLTGRFALEADPLTLAWSQFYTVAVLSGLTALFTESPSLAGVASGWMPLMYSGVFVIAIAFTLQIFAQKNAPPAHAAVLMSLEAVFGAVFGMLLLNDQLSGWEIVGCAVMFVGMLVSQLHRGERTATEKIAAREPV